MKFVSFINKKNKERLGLYYKDRVYDLKKSGEQLNIELPSKMRDMLRGWDEYLEASRNIENYIKTEEAAKFYEIEEIKLIAPVPHPASCRDGYAFRQHVATARRNRGVEMIPEFDQFPIFYFTNHNAVFGEGDVIVEKDHLLKLDFELEACVVICRKGKNISSSEADNYIGGYMIMNDLSARTLQMEEMKLNLGPAKGKDFATTIGPWLVTPDELEDNKIVTPFGNNYNLKMTAFHNGLQISEGNMSDMNWTFAEIIERASYGVELLPGDIIGSGTVGTGCYLELNGTKILEAKDKGQDYSPVWLQAGDVIELEIEKLGKLSNRIIAADTQYSILEKNKG